MTAIMDRVVVARRAGVPLLAVRTSDPFAFEAAVANACSAAKPVVPIATWDIIRGVRGLNREGAASIAYMGEDLDQMVNVPEMLGNAAKLPDKTVLVAHNLHMMIDDPVVVQAIANLRDQFRATRRTLIMAGVDMRLPAELASDVVIEDEALPGDDDLAATLQMVYGAALKLNGFTGPSELSKEDIERAVDAVTGLSAFMSEQAYAMCMTLAGLNVEALWDHKRQMISATKGLSVYGGTETLDDVCGIERIRAFLKGVINGPEAPRVVLFMDEIEKAIGSQNDTSNVSQDFLKAFLSWMEDTRATGLIAVGPPGSGKSMVAKGLGRSARTPTIEFDPGGMRGSLVGQSESAVRNALRTVDAVGRGRVFVIATCNSIGSLPPELRRRFTLGTWFFDLPTGPERLLMWETYIGKYKLTADPAILGFEEEGWTGAEIRNCCDIAYRLGCPLDEAATYIVPVSVAAQGQIARLREEASGRYLSASYAGRYRANQEAADAGRILDFGGIGSYVQGLS